MSRNRLAAPVPEGARGPGPSTELVIFVGVPASGKSSFFRARFAATHVHVSQDLLPRVRDRDRRQGRLIEAALRAGRSVVVDNVNATAAARVPLVALGRAHGARVVAYHFDSAIREAVERNRRRMGRERVPDVAIYVAARRLEPPRPAEGYDRVYRVRLAGGGAYQVSPVPDAGGPGPCPEPLDQDRSSCVQ